MFSQRNDKTRCLLDKKTALKEVKFILLYKNNQDTYIIYKGGIVSCDLVDIEVIYKQDYSINSKIIVDRK